MCVLSLGGWGRRLALWRTEAFFKVDLRENCIAEIVYRSLYPEIKSPPSTRIKVDLDVDGCFINVHIKADSLSSLRAAVNSYLRWISLLSRSLHVIKSLC